ncbi:MAG: GTPase HflX [Myxococcota bacterium]
MALSPGRVFGHPGRAFDPGLRHPAPPGRIPARSGPGSVSPGSDAGNPGSPSGTRSLAQRPGPPVDWGGRPGCAAPPAPPPRGELIRVFGNTHGLKANQVRQLERLFRRRLPADRLVTHEFARELTALTAEIRRQVGVLVDRRGSVSHVMVGDATSIELPDWGRLRAGAGRLRGLRCIHTHLGDEPLTRDDVTDLALLRLDAMVAIATGEDGLPGNAYVAALLPESREGSSIQYLEPAPPARLDLDFADWIRALEEELARAGRTRKVAEGERAILVSASAEKPADLETGLAELRELARSAGVAVVDVVHQRRSRPDPRFLIGQGRLQDLMIRAFQTDVDLVIVDQDLTPVQARNLGERLDLRVIDRTQLILDIFAQHATSRDGKLQVELAQLKYLLPRLAQRADRALSRLAGGIGGRGPGESKLEVDRRRVRDRVARLERELKRLRRQREGRRKRRSRRGLPILSIVGYTNAGKSTLLRTLTKTPVHVEDRMFATLDPASRRLRFPQDREVIVTDTVGFIRDLPPDLVAAFRATLEELEEADLLLHVVDASAPDLERRMAAVRRVIDDIGLAETPELLVFNQVDRLPPGEGRTLAERFGGVAISALQRKGLGELLEAVEQRLWESRSMGEGPRANALAQRR